MGKLSKTVHILADLFVQFVARWKPNLHDFRIRMQYSIVLIAHQVQESASTRTTRTSMKSQPLVFNNRCNAIQNKELRLDDALEEWTEDRKFSSIIPLGRLIAIHCHAGLPSIIPPSYSIQLFQTSGSYYHYEPPE